MISFIPYYQLLIAILVFLAQIYSPKIYLGYMVTPDFLLIYLTYLSVIHKRFFIIIIENLKEIIRLCEKK